VQLRVRYEPAHGSPLFAEPASLNLAGDGKPTGPPVVTAQAGKPAQAQGTSGPTAAGWPGR
jgi:hypothetical protein